MLGDVIGEICSWVLGVILPSPSTGRRRVLLQLGFGAAALMLEAWVFVLVDDPLHGPEWAFGLIMLGMLWGLIGFVASVVTLTRVKEHRVLTAVTVLITASAFFWPLSLVVVR